MFEIWQAFYLKTHHHWDTKYLLKNLSFRFIKFSLCLIINVNSVMQVLNMLVTVFKFDVTLGTMNRKKQLLSSNNHISSAQAPHVSSAYPVITVLREQSFQE